MIHTYRALHGDMQAVDICRAIERNGGKVISVSSGRIHHHGVAQFYLNVWFRFPSDQDMHRLEQAVEDVSKAYE